MKPLESDNLVSGAVAVDIVANDAAMVASVNMVHALKSMSSAYDAVMLDVFDELYLSVDPNALHLFRFDLFAMMVVVAVAASEYTVPLAEHFDVTQ